MIVNFTVCSVKVGLCLKLKLALLVLQGHSLAMGTLCVFDNRLSHPLLEVDDDLACCAHRRRYVVPLAILYHEIELFTERENVLEVFSPRISARYAHDRVSTRIFLIAARRVHLRSAFSNLGTPEHVKLAGASYSTSLKYFIICHIALRRVEFPLRQA